MFKKSAFTMIELVMVIVVMGIVASIGADIIAKMYENYIKTRAINKLQAQSEIVLNEIAKRLQFRIKDSVIARQSGSANFLNYVSLSDANDSYQILEWIGYDNDSFRGVSNPGWSGFIDLDSNQTNKSLGPHGTLKTPGSDLNMTNTIVKALSNNRVSLDHTNPHRPALIFSGQSNFDLEQYGWSGKEGNYTFRVSYTPGTNDVLNFDENISSKGLKEIFEQYKLAWSAYAVVPEGNNTNDFNLTLHYNYQPWYDENYTTGSDSILAQHVSTFKFTKTGDTIRLKLCINDANSSGGFNFAFCKEKVVY